MEAKAFHSQGPTTRRHLLEAGWAVDFTTSYGYGTLDAKPLGLPFRELLPVILAGPVPTPLQTHLATGPILDGLGLLTMNTQVG